MTISGKLDETGGTLPPDPAGEDSIRVILASCQRSCSLDTYSANYPGGYDFAQQSNFAGGVGGPGIFAPIQYACQRIKQAMALAMGRGNSSLIETRYEKLCTAIFVRASIAAPWGVGQCTRASIVRRTIKRYMAMLSDHSLNDLRRKLYKSPDGCSSSILYLCSRSINTESA